MTTSPSSALVTAFAPSGTLRASINLGNPILANKDATTGEPVGVSIDLAREFARRLGVGIELIVFEKAAASVDAVKNEKTDIGFFAVDPARSEGLRFTAPYVLIEGSYLVPESSALTDNAQVDAEGHRISVGSGSAYDLFLTREFKAATLVRAPTSPAVTDMFLAERLDVAAGVKQQLEAAARRPRVAERLYRGDEGQRFRSDGAATAPHQRGGRGAAPAALTLSPVAIGLNRFPT